jgi:hypothetical protein
VHHIRRFCDAFRDRRWPCDVPPDLAVQAAQWWDSAFLFRQGSESCETYPIVALFGRSEGSIFPALCLKHNARPKQLRALEQGARQLLDRLPSMDANQKQTSLRTIEGKISRARESLSSIEIDIRDRLPTEDERACAGGEPPGTPIPRCEWVHPNVRSVHIRHLRPDISSIPNFLTAHIAASDRNAYSLATAFSAVPTAVPGCLGF